MELLVRVKDKVNEDFYLNCQCTKRGDVIAAQADGWNWGIDELSLPFYRILKLPDMAKGDANALLAPELDTDPANPSKTLQRRAFKLDLDHPSLPQDLQDFIADDSRKQPTFLSSLSNINLLSLKMAKVPVQDPTVFGVNPNVFG